MGWNFRVSFDFGENLGVVLWNFNKELETAAMWDKAIENWGERCLKRVLKKFSFV